ncbi:hypothetical protein GCM10007938_15950 [Vibrio zhanjiangensis]|uniref:DUF721 domain-containing protein n=1 Tax=Vibrio zhanjiangensis TaxID=1046128 RepID=A0ABQ6EZC1_9VIBR|nr:hypothetical protein [Vibrio zhanjiangensis]GLT17817.1 hypothetical protein GCM10007938_15950 [Vibrio zhanjiangensis]
MTNSYPSKAKATCSSKCGDHKNVEERNDSRDKFGEGKKRQEEELLFNELVLGQVSTFEKHSPIAQPSNGESRDLNNVRAVVREWAEKLWASHNGEMLRVTARAGEIPITITSCLANGMANISISCTNPVFFERMKQHRADLDRKQSIAKVSFELITDSPFSLHMDQLQDEEHYYE